MLYTQELHDLSRYSFTFSNIKNVYICFHFLIENNRIFFKFQPCWGIVLSVDVLCNSPLKDWIKIKLCIQLLGESCVYFFIITTVPPWVSLYTHVALCACGTGVLYPLRVTHNQRGYRVVCFPLSVIQNSFPKWTSPVVPMSPFRGDFSLPTLVLNKAFRETSTNGDKVKVGKETVNKCPTGEGGPPWRDRQGAPRGAGPVSGPGDLSKSLLSSKQSRPRTQLRDAPGIRPVPAVWPQPVSPLCDPTCTAPLVFQNPATKRVLRSLNFCQCHLILL